MIEFRNVTKAFDDKIVLNGMSAKIETAEILFVIGKSGMGKSVMLKTIVGLLRPDSGEVFVNGREVTKLTEAEYLPIRRECGMVFQYPALLDSLTVKENVEFGVIAHSLSSSDDETASIVREKLALVKLGEEILLKYPTELSYGVQKRVSIARTLAVNPRYLLFDEPTTGLDPVATSAINRLISDLSRKLKVTSVVVSHDMHCAMEIADRIFLLDQGRIVAQGTPKELADSRVPLVRDFMKEAKARVHAPGKANS